MDAGTYLAWLGKNWWTAKRQANIGDSKKRLSFFFKRPAKIRNVTCPIFHSCWMLIFLGMRCSGRLFALLGPCCIQLRVCLWKSNDQQGTMTVESTGFMQNQQTRSPPPLKHLNQLSALAVWTRLTFYSLLLFSMHFYEHKAAVRTDFKRHDSELWNF